MAIVFPERPASLSDVPLPTPNPAGDYPNQTPSTTIYHGAVIPIIGTTDYLEFSAANPTFFTKKNAAGTTLYTITGSTYGIQYFCGVAIHDGVIYAMGYHTTGTYIGWIEVDLATGAVTDNFSTQTYATVPASTGGMSAIVHVTATEIILYNYKTVYTFNRSTKAKTSEANTKPLNAMPLDVNSDACFGWNGSSTSSGLSIHIGTLGSPQHISTIVPHQLSNALNVVAMSICIQDEYAVPYSHGTIAGYGAKYYYLNELIEYANKVTKLLVNGG